MAAKTSTKSTTKRNTKRPPANVAAETTATASVETTSIEKRTPAHDEIARRAYEMFLARGRQHGRAQEDWLNAERELRERYSVS